MIEEEVFQAATSVDPIKIRVDRPVSPRLQATTVVENRLADLRKQRGTIKARLTLFEKYLSKFQKDEIVLNATLRAEIELRIQSQTVIFEHFNKIQFDIEQLSGESDLLSQLEYREAFESQYFSLMAAAKCILYVNEQIVSSGSVGKPVSIKLPQIKLPTFDGSYDQWLEYRNSYLTMIHSRQDLDSIQKFHYLKSSLSGTASQVIGALEFTAPNYAHAWDLLESRFHNNRLLVQNHVKSLFATQSLHTESPAQIRKLIDSTLRNLRALQSLNEPTDSWDTLIIYLIVSKLDPSTEREWETQKGLLVTKKGNATTDPNNRITLDDLIVFLRNRADMLEMIKSNSSKPTSQQNKRHINSDSNPQPQTQSYASQKVNSDKPKQKRSCVLCGENHLLYSCAKFLNTSVQDRYTMVKAKNICLNCLRTDGHSSNECSFSPCKLCQEKHNTLLHNDVRVSEGLGTVASTHTALPTSSLQQSADTQVGTESNVLTSHAAIQPVLLSTALIDVPDAHNHLHTVRALLDSGSQNCFITESLINRLQLPTIQSTIRISGVGQSISQCNHTCKTIIRSKVKGYQVPPAELEAVLREHPAVNDAAVIGVPHAVNGEEPKAFVVLKTNHTCQPKDIIDFVKERVAPYKRINDVTVIDNIPKSSAGKILRRVLKENYY